MPSKRWKAGLVLSALNVLVLVALLAAKAPEFDRLRAQDAGRVDVIYFDSRPIYAAGRLLSGGDVRASLAEQTYLLLNAPAVVAALMVTPPLSTATVAWATGAYLTPSVWQSWVLACALATGVGGWAFLIGSLVARQREVPPRAA